MQTIEDFLDWSAIFEEQELSMREPEQCAGLDVGLPLLESLCNFHPSDLPSVEAY